jgi:hypothetical protein
MKGWQVNDKLERIWKEATVAIFKVMSWNSPVVTEEYYERQSG